MGVLQTGASTRSGALQAFRNLANMEQQSNLNEVRYEQQKEALDAARTSKKMQMAGSGAAAGWEYGPTVAGWVKGGAETATTATKAGQAASLAGMKAANDVGITTGLMASGSQCPQLVQPLARSEQHPGPQRPGPPPAQPQEQQPERWREQPQEQPQALELVQQLAPWSQLLGLLSALDSGCCLGICSNDGGAAGCWFLLLLPHIVDRWLEVGQVAGCGFVTFWKIRHFVTNAAYFHF